MKRTLLAVMFLLSALSVYADTKPNTLAAALYQAAGASMPTAPSIDASKNGVVMLKLRITGTWDSPSSSGDIKEYNIQCPAVRITDNYLMAYRGCMDISGKGEVEIYEGAASSRIEQASVSRHIKYITLNGETISDSHFTKDGSDKFFLVFIDGNKLNLRKAVEGKPIASLFVAKDPNKLPDVFEKLILNRETMTPFSHSRECAKVDIKTVCTAKQCFQICWKAIDGDTGDPVFGLNPNKTTEEYLMGFNARNAEKSRNSGPNYYFFSDAELDFLRNKLPQKAYNYIIQHKKDETNI